MDDFDLAHLVMRDLGRLERSKRQFLNESLRDVGLHGKMYRFLLLLEEHPGESQDFITAEIGTDKTHTARMARELEDLGYLRREADERDRRRNRLYLTDTGAAQLPRIREVMQTWASRVMVGISEEEVRSLLLYLNRMNENAENV